LAASRRNSLADLDRAEFRRYRIVRFKRGMHLMHEIVVHASADATARSGGTFACEHILQKDGRDI
jgi:hypothetical protein